MVVRVLMVCLGNICRSPMAEALLRHKCTQNVSLTDVVEVDSCGTAGFHTGSSPDRRAVSVLAQHGITTTHHARTLRVEDASRFDYVLCMDQANLVDAQELFSEEGAGSGYKATVQLLGDYDPQKVAEVDDPYYVGLPSAFDDCFTHLDRCLGAFMASKLTR